LFSFKRKHLAIDSDTQYNIPKNIFTRIVKWIYLSLVFRTPNILGFAGGSKSHKDLFRAYGMKEKNIFLIPMVVDNSRFYCKSKVFPDVFVFLYVGRLEPYKGVEQLIKAFNCTFHDKKAILRIIGDGSQKKHLTKKYESDKVNFLGPLFDQDLTHQFHIASCFVCPSKFEPWGLVVNEALSASLPVIATQEVGSSSDLIKNNKNGFVVNDMNDFKNSMLQLYNNASLLYDYSRNAKLFMQKNWNYDIYVKCFQVVKNKILNK
jgi:glycosyltransferase involved in cell wall biosynthesis